MKSVHKSKSRNIARFGKDKQNFFIIHNESNDDQDNQMQQSVSKSPPKIKCNKCQESFSSNKDMKKHPCAKHHSRDKFEKKLKEYPNGKSR